MEYLSLCLVLQYLIVNTERIEKKTKKKLKDKQAELKRYEKIYLIID